MFFAIIGTLCGHYDKVEIIKNRAPKSLFCIQSFAQSAHQCSIVVCIESVCKYKLLI